MDNWKEDLNEIVNGKDILITGGTGSFGKTLLHILLTDYSPRRVVVYSRDELKQFELQEKYPDEKYPNVRFFLGDVRDLRRLKEAFRGVNIVIHAAALKQVPALEYNPQEAIKTNVMGAMNIISAAMDDEVKQVVALSTDKACGPVNLYGATKLCSDKLFISANNLRGERDISFAVVRYGNVFGSRGSIIPVFHRAKKMQQDILITDEKMTRFTITLPDAVEFVLKSLVMMKGGEMFVPKIPSYRLPLVAEAVAPRCGIKVIGRRPGEKLHESLIPPDESYRTIELKDRFIVEADGVLPEKSALKRFPGAKRVPSDFSYSSGRNTWWCSIDMMRETYSLWLQEYERMSKEEADREAFVCEEEFSEEITSGSLALDGGKPVRRNMLPYAQQGIDDHDIDAVTHTLRSNFLTTGPEVSGFEEDVSRLTNVKHAVAVSSGTAALHCAMYAAGVGPGDEVIVPCITFAASANVVVMQGASVVFADVEKETLNIDVESVKKLISAKTKAIICVHMAGQPCKMRELSELSKQHNCLLIEDACHALGSTYGGSRIGGCEYSDMACLSFHPVKHVATGEGGMLLTNNEAFSTRARCFRNHGLSTDHNERKEKGTFYYEMRDLGYNYRLTDIQCALGRSQLKKLDSFVHRRRSIAVHYDEVFGKVDGVVPLKVIEGVEHAYHLYIIRLELGKLKVSRNEIFDALRAEGIGVNVHYIPVHLHPYYKNRFGTCEGMCPNAESVFDEIITIPLFPRMRSEDIHDVTRAVIKVIRAYKK